MGEFVNLDTLVAEPKTIILAGRPVNVAKVPAIVVFRADELRDKLRNLKPENSRAIIEEAVELILLITKASGDPLDKAWLLDNASVEQILEFIAAATLGKPVERDKKKEHPKPGAGG